MFLGQCRFSQAPKEPPTTWYVGYTLNPPLGPYPSSCQEWRVAAVSGQGQKWAAKNSPQKAEKWPNTGSQRHHAHSTCAIAPSDFTSKYNFKDTMIQNFRTMTTAP